MLTLNHGLHKIKVAALLASSKRRNLFRGIYLLLVWHGCCMVVSLFKKFLPNLTISFELVLMHHPVFNCLNAISAFLVPFL